MRGKIFQIVVLLISGLLVIKLFDLQIIKNSSSDFLDRASIQKVYEFPERGYIYDRNDKLIVSNEPYYDLMIIPSDVDLNDSVEVSKLLNIQIQTFNTKFNKSRIFSNVKPSVFMSGITKNEFASIQEKLWKYGGFFIQKNSKRKYNYKTASNILGYTSEVNGYEVESNPYYKAGEMIGRQGLEKTYEVKLRGKKGVKYLQKDKFNRIIGSYNNGIYDSSYVPAKNIKLTLDIDLQKYGDSLLKNKFGSIIAIEPKTGEILSIVNSPGYDPSILVGRDRSDNYRKLYLDSIGKPLLKEDYKVNIHLVLRLKIINALIGLQENIIDEKTLFSCNGGHFYAKNSFMKCHTNEATKY